MRRLVCGAGDEGPGIAAESNAKHTETVCDGSGEAEDAVTLRPTV